MSKIAKHLNLGRREGLKVQPEPDFYTELPTKEEEGA